MIKYTIKTLADTKKLAKKIANQLKGGEVIGFTGNLGAGKTTFIQFLAKALGVKQVVNSPTFNIIKIYPINPIPLKKVGVWSLIHIDAYRLNSAEELKALGVEEFVDNPKTITVIEWMDKVKEVLPKNMMVIKISLKKNKERVFIIKQPTNYK